MSFNNKGIVQEWLGCGLLWLWLCLADLAVCCLTYPVWYRS